MCVVFMQTSISLIYKHVYYIKYIYNVMLVRDHLLKMSRYLGEGRRRLIKYDEVTVCVEQKNMKRRRGGGLNRN